MVEDQSGPYAAQSCRPVTLDAVTSKDIDEPMTDRFGVVYTIGPSPLEAKIVWVGTDDGLIHVTHDDGATWSDVTPPAMTHGARFRRLRRTLRRCNRIRLG